VRTTDIGKKVGWDAPLALQLTADVNALADSFADAAPRGDHSHDLMASGVNSSWQRSRRNRASVPRGTTARLSKWLAHRANWQVVYKQDVLQRAAISVFLAYAQIIDKGGTVPAARADNLAMCMAFNNGSDVFTKYRRGYTIAPREYVSKGFNAFMDNTGKAGLRVGWRPSTSGR